MWSRGAGFPRRGCPAFLVILIGASASINRAGGGEVAYLVVIFLDDAKPRITSSLFDLSRLVESKLTIIEDRIDLPLAVLKGVDFKRFHGQPTMNANLLFRRPNDPPAKLPGNSQRQGYR